VTSPVAAADPAGQYLELAPAKVNLALHVRRRRADGYHDIESWFAFAELADRLTAKPAADWELSVTGPKAAQLGAALADNLVLRAAHAFADAAASPLRYALHLHKCIPVAAGLGGGSADAAAVLRLLNRLTPAPLPEAQLRDIAASIGADVPACLLSRSQIGRGVGEVLHPAPAVTGLRLLLINPGVPVATAAVFAGWDGVDGGALGADWRQGRNDLEIPASRLQPAIGTALDWLRRIPGAQHVRMSGSGATCFAVFAGDVPRISLPPGWWAAATRLL
jgi:4-diphosphocytidyl-2-C-methyl-D-erythritol kinase